MAYEVPTAHIGGGAGLITGAFSSVVAPWANWSIEKKKLKRQRRAGSIAEWRAGIDELRGIEHKVAPLMPMPGPAGSRGFMVRASEPVPDPVDADISRKGWYISLREQLPTKPKRAAEVLRKMRVCDRKADLPTFLAEEVAKLERGWKLV